MPKRGVRDLMVSLPPSTKAGDRGHVVLIGPCVKVSCGGGNSVIRPVAGELAPKAASLADLDSEQLDELKAHLESALASVNDATTKTRAPKTGGRTPKK